MKNCYFFIFAASIFALFLTPEIFINNQIQKIILLSGITVSLICFYTQRLKLCFIMIIISFAMLFSIHFINLKMEHSKIANSNFLLNSYITIQGTILEYPVFTNDSTIVFLRSNTQYFNNHYSNNCFVSRIKIKGFLKGYYKGDKIEISCKLFKQEFNQNFNKPQIRNYPLYKNFHFNGYCKSSLLVGKIKDTNLFFKLIGKWRDNIRKQIKAFYNKKTIYHQGVFLQAIILGDRGQLSENLKESLLSSGIYHLLAISGAHIGIISFFFLLLLKIFRIKHRIRYLLTGFILIVFLFISGFHISAFRAVLMAEFFIIGKLFHLKYSPLNIISLCALIILFINPAQFLDPGFILTFSLTYSIVLGREFFVPLLKPLNPGLREFLSANFSVSLLSIPLSLQFFHRYSLIAPFMNLIMIPITAIITSLAFLVVLLAPVSKLITTFLFFLLKIPFFVFFKIQDFVQSHFSPSIFAPPPGFVIIFLIFSSFILLCKSKSKKTKLFSLLLILICLITSSVSFKKYIPKDLEFYFLDVGQGDSSVAIFSNGDGLLIDGGGVYNTDFQIGKNIILPFILKKQIKLKFFSISHFHPDHLKGIIELIPIIKPEEIWISSSAEKDILYQSFKKVLLKYPSIKLIKIFSGYSRKIGNSHVSCLYPETFLTRTKAMNNHSQILKINGQNFSILLTGDIEKEAEFQLLKNKKQKLKCDILKIAHHGSKSSTSSSFLKHTNPKIALISFQKNNYFGFPHPEVLNRLKQRKITIYDTATHGGIKISYSVKKGIIVDFSK